MHQDTVFVGFIFSKEIHNECIVMRKEKVNELGLLCCMLNKDSVVLCNSILHQSKPGMWTVF